MKLRLILLLFVLCVLIVKPVSAQGPTPPPPLIKVCVDEGWGECVSEALEIGGLILLIIT